jgi:hypothetical protein
LEGIRRKSLERYRPNTETLCVVEMFIYVSKPLKAIPLGSVYSKMVAPCAPYRTISTVRYRGGVDLRRQIRDIISTYRQLGCTRWLRSSLVIRMPNAVIANGLTALRLINVAGSCNFSSGALYFRGYYSRSVVSEDACTCQIRISDLGGSKLRGKEQDCLTLRRENLEQQIFNSHSR